MTHLALSLLPKTWIVDIDGVVFIHNSYLDQGDRLIPNAREFLASLPSEDRVVLLSARTEDHRETTIRSLESFGIRYDALILGLPVGERLLINDAKPDGLVMAHAINTRRDVFDVIEVERRDHTVDGSSR
jgi:hypothetical protein